MPCHTFDQLAMKRQRAARHTSAVPLFDRSLLSRLHSYLSRFGPCSAHLALVSFAELPPQGVPVRWTNSSTPCPPHLTKTADTTSSYAAATAAAATAPPVNPVALGGARPPAWPATPPALLPLCRRAYSEALPTAIFCGLPPSPSTPPSPPLVHAPLCSPFLLPSFLGEPPRVPYPGREYRVVDRWRCAPSHFASSSPHAKASLTPFH